MKHIPVRHEPGPLAELNAFFSCEKPVKKKIIICYYHKTTFLIQSIENKLRPDIKR